jgi:serine/threonine protein kinase
VGVADVFEPLADDDPVEVAGYRLRARLGAGGMGRVYLSCTPGGRPVAIKVVRAEFADDPEFRRRFAQEVEAAQRVHGLHTAQVLDADPTAPRPWLATAYVPGPSLHDAVSTRGPLPLASLYFLIAGVAESLTAIHSVGVVHRDLKPSNVLLAADGPRVIDFGIARAADATALTRSGMRIGSPHFMSPEQARGLSAVPATDVFALGALAMFAATGRSPFGEGNEAAVLYRVVHEPADLDGCPDALRPLVTACLAKDPGERPTPSQIIRDCRAHTAGDTVTLAETWLPADLAATVTQHGATPELAPRPSVTGRRIDLTRRRIGLLAAAVGLVGLGAGLAVALGSSSPTQANATATGSLSHTTAAGRDGASAPVSTTVAATPTSSIAAAGGLPGTLIGTYHVDLPSPYGLDLDNDPAHPIHSDIGTLIYSDDNLNLISGGEMALLASGQSGSYQTCLNNTQYTQLIGTNDLQVGSLICVTTTHNRVALIRVTHVGSMLDVSNYMGLDITLWQGL